MENSPVPKYLQEDGLSDECRELLSTLPREKGWLNDHIYQYEGFWFEPRHLQGLLRCREHFQAHDTDIILVTNPKSGTTWLKALSYALLNRSRFGVGDHHHPLLTTNPHALVPGLEFNLYRDNEEPDLSAFSSPRLFGSHLPIGSLPSSVKNSSCKIVYLCRNPKDMFVSMWHFVNKLRPEGTDSHALEDAFDRFCDGASPYGPFWDHILCYWKESLEDPRKVLFVKYEEIKGQPADQVRRLAEFLGCPFSAEEEDEGVVGDVLRLCSFDHLSNLDVNKVGKSEVGISYNSLFRKGKVGDSVNFLTSEMIKKMDCITELKLRDTKLQL